MIVAAHQPAFLPWLGYLHKMATCDLFVVVDCVQYEQQNFQNRNRVKRNDGAGWVTVPLYRGKRDEAIADKRVCNQAKGRHAWGRVIWRTLEIHYARAPFWSAYAPQLRAVLETRWERLADLNAATLELARKWLSITTPIVRSSTLGLSGVKTERIADMCRKVKASAYVSGLGGSAAYLDEGVLTRSGIAVRWQRFAHPVYPQRYPALGFLPNLAFIDLVMNCGPEASAILRS